MAIILLLASALLALVGLALNWPPLLALAALVFGTLFALLGLVQLEASFQEQPAARRKQELLEQIAHLSRELQAVRVQAAQIKARRLAIESERARRSEIIKPTYRAKSAALNTRFKEIDLAERTEIASQLAKIQEKFCATAVQQAMVRRAKLPGLSSRLVDELEAQGVRCAADITPNLSAKVPALGAFLETELVAWSKRVVSDAEARKPLHLPHDLTNEIRQKYNQKRLEVKHEIEQLGAVVQDELIQIDNRSDSMLQELGAQTAGLEKRLNEMGKQYLEAQEALKGYAHINFSDYFRACLSE